MPIKTVYISKDLDANKLSKFAELTKKGKVAELDMNSGCYNVKGMSQFDAYKDAKLIISKAILEKYKGLFTSEKEEIRLDAGKENDLKELIEKECIAL